MITDQSMNILAHRVHSVIPVSEPRKIENVLLNGMIHIQTVGTPASVCNVTALSTLAEWQHMLTAASESGAIDVEFEGELYQGVVRDMPRIDDYTRGMSRANRVYKISFQLILGN